jgi:cytochrome b involved in lipid metabolism
VAAQPHACAPALPLALTALRCAPGLQGAGLRKYTLAEVAAHSAEDDCWTVLDGRVYNMTPYVPFHPGGKPILMEGAGRDCTALFKKYHPWVNAHFMLHKCLLGALHDSEPGAQRAASAAADEDDDGPD